MDNLPIIIIISNISISNSIYVQRHSASKGKKAKSILISEQVRGYYHFCILQLRFQRIE